MANNTAKSIHENTGEKEIYPKVHIPNLFYGDRKKFKTYCNQIRLFIRNDNKRTKKTLKNVTEKIMWAVSFLRENAYARFEPYLEYYLK